MTQRRRLDLHLAEEAVAAGAEFRDGVRVDELVLDGDGVTADVGGTRVRAAYVVGADGANGQVARAAGLGEGIVTGVALEANAAWGDLDPRPYAATAWVELGVVAGGYGWVFPKGDHANLGVGGWHGEGPRLRAHLERLAREHGVDPRRLRDVRGHRLPMRRLGAPAARGRALLVGDAAGLVDPLSGDGLYEAFVSARLAADAVLAGRPEDYEARALGRARPARRRLVEGEARRRPLPEGVLLGRTRARGLRRRRGPPPGRPRASARRSWPRAPAAACALAPRAAAPPTP